MNNILFVLPTDKIGGAERVAMNLVKYLSRKSDMNIVVYFLTGESSNSWSQFEESENINFFYQGANKVSTSVYSFSRYLIKHKFDFIYSTHAHTNALLSALRKLKIVDCRYLIFRESSILSTRFSGVKKKFIDIMYFLYGAQDLTITQTNLMKLELERSRPKFAVKNVHCIPNPVDSSFINEKVNEPINFEDSDDYTIISVGRLIKIKNHSILIESLSLLDKKLRAKIKLFILGSGPELYNLNQLVSTLELHNNVFFLGNVKNPYSMMSKADLGVISSLSEGFPNVLLEMMAAGTKNIITTPCTGDLETISGINVMNSFSSEELSKKIEISIRKQANNSIVYKENINQRTVEKFWEHILRCVHDER